MTGSTDLARADIDTTLFFNTTSARARSTAFPTTVTLHPLSQRSEFVSSLRRLRCRLGSRWRADPARHPWWRVRRAAEAWLPMRSST